MRLAHAVFDKSGQHFLLVILGCFVYFGKNRLKLVSHLIGNGVETLVTEKTCSFSFSKFIFFAKSLAMLFALSRSVLSAVSFAVPKFLTGEQHRQNSSLRPRFEAPRQPFEGRMPSSIVLDSVLFGDFKNAVIIFTVKKMFFPLKATAAPFPKTAGLLLVL